MRGAPVEVSGRVIAAWPLDLGGFGLLVGPGPKMHRCVATSPVALGSAVTVRGLQGDILDLEYQGRKSTVTYIDRAQIDCQPEAYARRVVPPGWMRRVAEAMLRPLYHYQEEGAAWIASQLTSGTGAVLADDPGLGKSAQTVAALSATALYPAIVVCPTSLKRNWEREFGWAKTPPGIQILSGREGELDPYADVVILNYDLLRFREAQLAASGARSIVFDEAQALKEPKPGRFHRAAVGTRLAYHIRSVVELTGTPIMNDAKDLWRLLHIADPAAWPSFDEYDEYYCRPPPNDEPPADDGRIVTTHGRVEHLGELQTMVQPVLLRRTKSEVLSDLPPKARRSVLVQLDDDIMSDYRAVERDFMAWLRSFEDDRALRASRAETLAKLTALRQLAALGKMHRAVPEYLSGWFPGGKGAPIVIFAYHTEVLKRTWHLCEQLGLTIVGIGSGDHTDRRQEAVDYFQNGYADVFLAPISCGGVGLNLQRASDALFIERVWTPGQMTQAEDRIHRIGSLSPVTITHLDAVDTIDVQLALVLESKQQLIDGILDEADARPAVEVVDSIVDLYRGA